MTDSELMDIWFVPVRLAVSAMVMEDEKVTGGLGPDWDGAGWADWRLAVEDILVVMTGDSCVGPEYGCHSRRTRRGTRLP